jgi:hypothetical protein
LEISRFSNLHRIEPQTTEMLAGDPVHAEMEQVDDVEMKMDAAAPEATTNAPVGKDLLAASLFPELDAPAGPSHTVDDVIRDLSQDMSQDMLDWSDEEGQTSSFAIGTSGTSAPQSIAPGSFQPKPKPKPTPVPRELTKKDQDDGNFLALMKVFYQRLFPFKKYYQWLSYGNGESLLWLAIESSKCSLIQLISSSQDLLFEPRVQFHALRGHLLAVPVVQGRRGTQAGNRPSLPREN